MNVYDTANKLAQEIKTSEEYVNLKMARQAINLNTELKNKIMEFEKLRYITQIEVMQQGKNDEEKMKKMQDLYQELMENMEAKKFFEAETKFNILFSDVNKIIGQCLEDIMDSFEFSK